MTLVVGVLVGLVLGLTGAGGSVLAVPLFLEVLGQSMETSVGVSLGVVAVGALVGALARVRAGTILYAPGLAYAIAGAIVAPLGQRIGAVLPEPARIGGFALLVAIVAARMWRQASRDPEATRVVRAGLDQAPVTSGPACRFSPTGRLELRPRCVWRLALGGVATGLLSGLFGVGGGFVIVPSLVLLTGIDMHRAVATSLFVIALVAAAGFLGYARTTAALPLPLLRDVAVGTVAGMGLGTLLSKRVAGPGLTRFFVVVMLAMTGLTVFNTFVARGHA